MVNLLEVWLQNYITWIQVHCWKKKFMKNKHLCAKFNFSSELNEMIKKSLTGENIFSQCMIWNI